MTNHSKADMQKFVVDCRAEEARQRELEPIENHLWDLAEASPFEPTRIITTNEKVLADPYLMRVYLTPEREKLERTLQNLGVPPAYARLMQHTPRPYLHYFFRGDDDRAYHNHPWKRSLSVILVGGFIEHVWNFELKRPLTQLHKPGQAYWLKRGTYHRAELLPGKKCWTLFTSMGRVQASDGQDWEFYDPETDTFTPWGEWTSAMARPRNFREHAKPVPMRSFAPDHVSLRSDLPRPGADVSVLHDDPDAGHGGYNWSALRR